MSEKPSVGIALHQGFQLGLIAGSVIGILLAVWTLMIAVNDPEGRYVIFGDPLKMAVAFACLFGMAGVCVICSAIVSMSMALAARIAVGWISSAKARIVMGLVLGALLGAVASLAVLTLLSPDKQDFTRPKVLYPWLIVAWTLLGMLSGTAGAIRVRTLEAG